MMTNEEIEQTRAALRKMALEFVSEVNATKAPGPQIYDPANDAMRPVTQDDVDKLREHAECSSMRRVIIQNVLTMNREGLMELKQFLSRSVVTSHRFTPASNRDTPSPINFDVRRGDD